MPSINTIFNGIFDNSTTILISLPKVLTCLTVSLIIGFIIALSYTFEMRGGLNRFKIAHGSAKEKSSIRRKYKYSKSFVVTLAIIPAVVCEIIMLINGNVGAGVAVAGAFSLVRFRSAPGSAKEIGAIFLAMGAGLATGMGYLAYAMIFAIILCAVSILFTSSRLSENSNNNFEKSLKITIPEDLDYTEIFDDLMQKYTDEYELVNVKTTNMGSLFKLTYDIVLKDLNNEKKFIDELRCRNGNLEIISGRREFSVQEL